MQLEVIENLLSDSFADKIEDAMVNNDMFPWFFHPHTVDTAVEGEWVLDSSTKDSLQFVHSFYHNTKQNSEYLNLVIPVMNVLRERISSLSNKQFTMVRIKSNLMIKDPSYPDHCYNVPHKDGNLTELTLLYYVNDSDGETVFFNEYFDGNKMPESVTIKHKQKPKKNTAVLFNSNLLHTSSPPKINDQRVVINFVFTIE
jgi:hypothetical protein